MIKLLALDMDGTCLNSQVELEPETREAIVSAIDKGVTVIPTSGRVFGILPKEILEIPGIDYVITSNGAVIQNTATGEEIFRQTLSNEDVLKAVKLTEPFNPQLEIYSHGNSYLSKSDNDRLEDFVTGEYLDLYRDNTVVVSDEEFERCEVFV